ncbi:MAG: rod-binding protein [Hyphomonadaceae bacterium]
MTDLALPALPPIDPRAAQGAGQRTAQGDEVMKKIAGLETREQAAGVAKEFERMFLAEMLQPMFEGLKTDGPFGGGTAEAMFRPMMIDQYADAISQAGGVGIADAVMTEILRLQGLE